MDGWAKREEGTLQMCTAAWLCSTMDASRNALAAWAAWSQTPVACASLGCSAHARTHAHTRTLLLGIKNKIGRRSDDLQPVGASDTWLRDDQDELRHRADLEWNTIKVHNPTRCHGGRLELGDDPRCSNCRRSHACMLYNRSRHSLNTGPRQRQRRGSLYDLM